jgi:hypothetical protein
MDITNRWVDCEHYLHNNNMRSLDDDADTRYPKDLGCIHDRNSDRRRKRKDRTMSRLTTLSWSRPSSPTSVTMRTATLATTTAITMEEATASKVASANHVALEMMHRCFSSYSRVLATSTSTRTMITTGSCVNS